MIRELKGVHSYSKVMLILSVLTFIFGLASGFIGEMFLPFASAFLAVLFLFEKPQKRFLSFLVPLITVIPSIVFNGIFGIISVEYILLALIIVLCYRYSASKAECSVYMTVAVALFTVLSLYLGAAKAIESFAMQEVIDYYVEFYSEMKLMFVEFVSEYTVLLNDGTSEHLATVEQAAQYFDNIMNLAISMIVIFSFAIVGIAIKIFTALTLRYSKRGILKSFAHFIPSTVLAYAYIVVLIVSIFTSTENVFGIAVANISQILMIVFAYIGFQYFLSFAKISGKRTTVYIAILAAIILMPGLAIQISSFLGTYITIAANKNMYTSVG